MADDFSWLYQGQPKTIEGEHASPPQQTNADNFEWLYNNPSRADQVTSTGPSFGEKLYNVGQGAAVGAVKGAANVADAFLTPTLQDITPGNDRTFGAIAEQHLPPAKNKIAEATTEGAVSAAPAGPLGAVVGGAAAGSTEALNQYNPGHPIANTLYPMAGSALVSPGLARSALRGGRLLGEGAGLLERSPMVQARLDQGITSGTPFAVSDEDLWYKLQRGIRESIFGSPINQANEGEIEQLGSAVNRNADTLGPATTKQQVGTQEALGDGVSMAKKLIRDEREQLDQFVDPKTTQINAVPFIDRAIDQIASEPGNHISLVGGKIHTGDGLIDRLMDNVIQHNQNGNLPLAAVRQMKQEVGDRLEETILNGDESRRQLRLMYGVLADAEQTAYAGPIGDYFKQLKAAEHSMYDDMENFAQPLLKEGLAPEKVARAMSSDMKLGGTKLQKAFELIDMANPNMRNYYASMILRDMGKNNVNEFDPNRYFKNWQGMSPEAKQTLFGQGPNKDIPKALDQLALLSEGIGKSANAVNRSGTAGTEEILHIARIIGGLGGLTAGYEGDKYLHDQGDIGEKAGMGIGSALAGAALSSTLGNRMMARLMTNPAFIRWIATPVPVDKIPYHLRGLAAVAGEYPNLKNDLSVFQDSAHRIDFENLKYRNDPFASTKELMKPVSDYPSDGMPFAQGGAVGFLDGGYNDALPSGGPTGYSNGGLNSNPKYALGGLTDTPDGPTIKTEKGGKHKDTSQEDYATMMHNRQTTPDISREMMLMMQPQGYSKGGAVDARSEHGYKDNRPFYNPPTGSGYAEGGEVEDNASILDRVLGNWRGFGDRDNVRSWISNLPHYHPQTDPRMEIDPAESNTDSRIKSSYDPFNFLDEQEANGPVYPRQSFEDAINDRTTSYAEGGNVVANENEPPGSLIDQFLNHNSSVIPFKTGAAGKYNNQDFMGYHMGNASDPQSGTTMGFMDSVTPKDILNYDPQKANTIWGNDVPVEPSRPANSNEQLPSDDYSDIDNFVKGMAQGGAVDDDKMLNQIAYRESGFKNVMNYINDPKHTAGGIYQITNTTWKEFAPGSILSHWSRAIDAPPEVQRQVAKLILDSPGGIHRWIDYNPKLRADIQSGHYGNFDSQMASLKGSSENTKGSSESAKDSDQTNVEPVAQEQEAQQQETEAPQETPSQPSILEAVLSDNPLAQQLVRTIMES